MNFRVTLTGFLLILLIPFIAAAQSSTLKGSLLDNETKSPIPGATIVLKGTALSAVTDDLGSFSIYAVPFGNYTIEVVAAGFEAINGAVFNVNVNSSNVDAGVLSLAHSITSSTVSDDNIPTVSLSHQTTDTWQCWPRTGLPAGLPDTT